MINNATILGLYRKLPFFRGKFTFGKKLFSSWLDKSDELHFTAHFGLKYTIPNSFENIGKELLINGIYERDVIRAILKQVKTGDVFMDVGSNIGSIGLPVCKLRKDIHYYGIEPTPETFKILKKNFSDNNIANYGLYPVVLSNTVGNKMKFYYSQHNGKNSLAPTYSHDFYIMESETIDHLCHQNNIDRIDFLKIDVQGYELLVLQGARKMLEKGAIKKILFEFEYWAEDQANVERGSAQQFLLDMGYKLFRLNMQPILEPLKDKEEMIFGFPINE